jgi:hypothetical protein
VRHYGRRVKHWVRLLTLLLLFLRCGVAVIVVLLGFLLEKNHFLLRLGCPPHNDVIYLGLQEFVGVPASEAGKGNTADAKQDSRPMSVPIFVPAYHSHQRSSRGAKTMPTLLVGTQMLASLSQGEGTPFATWPTVVEGGGDSTGCTTARQYKDPVIRAMCGNALLTAGQVRWTELTQPEQCIRM